MWNKILHTKSVSIFLWQNLCLCCPYWEHWNVNLSEFRLEIYSLFLIHFYVTWISIFRDLNKFRIPYNWVLSLILIQKPFNASILWRGQLHRNNFQQQTTPRHFPRVVFLSFLSASILFLIVLPVPTTCLPVPTFLLVFNTLIFFSFSYSFYYLVPFVTHFHFNMFINIKFLWMRFQPSLEEKILVSFSLHNQVWRCILFGFK